MKEAIQARLFNALLLDGPLSQALYEWEMEENLKFWRQEMLRDKDDFLVAVTENSGDVALLLIDKKGKLFVNEDGRRWLRRKWNTPGVYASNMLLFVPQMAQQLHEGEFWVMGVRILPDWPTRPTRPTRPIRRLGGGGGPKLLG